MLEVARRFGEESGDGLHAELIQQFGQNDTAHAVHAVECYAEIGFPDGFYIHEVKSEHHIDVLLVVCIVLAIRTEVVNVGIFEVLCLCDAEHLVTFFFVEELTLCVEQLQGIPHTGIMTGGDDDTAACAFHCDGNFCGGCGSEADVDNVEAHAHECAANHILDHRPGDACVATDHDFIALYRRGATNKGCVC